MMPILNIPSLVPLYVDPRFPGMDKRFAVKKIVRARMDRAINDGKGSRAVRRWARIHSKKN